MSIYAKNKIMASQDQISRINDVLYHIHKDISTELPAKDLATIAAYSEQHFHRLFKEVVGESVHHYIRRTRLEFAANMLMLDNKASVLEAATRCGFSSVSSFSRAFKETFGLAPGNWRCQGQLAKDPPYLANPEIADAYKRIRNKTLVDMALLELPPRKVAYVRHRGYDRSIRYAWQTLLSWANAEERRTAGQFGLYHSNPAWVSLEDCRYVACLEIDRDLLRRGRVSSLVIPGGLHAVFSIKGRFGELLPHLSLILEDWLPSSGFKMQATPAYVHYQKNPFLDQREEFELTFNLPISII